MSKEKTEKYYLEENFNCAETILLLSIEEYDLQIKKDYVRLLKGFGGGMYKERTCGVVTGGIAVLSLLYDGERLKNKVIKYQDLVEKHFNHWLAIKSRRLIAKMSSVVQESSMTLLQS